MLAVFELSENCEPFQSNLIESGKHQGLPEACAAKTTCRSRDGIRPGHVLYLGSVGDEVG